MSIHVIDKLMFFLSLVFVYEVELMDWIWDDYRGLKFNGDTEELRFIA